MRRLGRAEVDEENTDFLAELSMILHALSDLERVAQT